jgi:hypothetical protein
METIRSFQDYVDQMPKLLSDASYEKQLFFCTKCVEKIFSKYAKVILEELGEIEQKQLSEIIDYLSEQPPAFDEKARTLQANLSKIGCNSEEDDEEIEFENDVIDVLSCFEHALQHILTKDPRQAYYVSETLINNLDFYVSGDYEQYDLKSMFIFPEMRSELDWQLSLIKASATR